MKKDLSRRNSDESFDDELIVEIKDLNKCYSSTNKCVLKNISFNLYENQISSLLGQNGAGLSFLLLLFLF